MIRRPPRSTQSRSSAASDVYKRQRPEWPRQVGAHVVRRRTGGHRCAASLRPVRLGLKVGLLARHTSQERTWRTALVSGAPRVLAAPNFTELSAAQAAWSSQLPRFNLLAAEAARVVQRLWDDRD